MFLFPADECFICLSYFSIADIIETQNCLLMFLVTISAPAGVTVVTLFISPMITKLQEKFSHWALLQWSMLWYPGMMKSVRFAWNRSDFSQHNHTDSTSDWAEASEPMRLFIPRHHDHIHVTSLEFVLYEVLKIDYTATAMDHAAFLSPCIPGSLLACTLITEISGPRSKIFPKSLVFRSRNLKSRENLKENDDWLNAGKFIAWVSFSAVWRLNLWSSTSDWISSGLDPCLEPPNYLFHIWLQSNWGDHE